VTVSDPSLSQMREELRVSEEFLARYNRPGPRYTSYPTAPVWNDDSASTISKRFTPKPTAINRPRTRNAQADSVNFLFQNVEIRGATFFMSFLYDYVCMAKPGTKLSQKGCDCRVKREFDRGRFGVNLFEYVRCRSHRSKRGAVG